MALNLKNGDENGMNEHDLEEWTVAEREKVTRSNFRFFFDYFIECMSGERNSIEWESGRHDESVSTTSFLLRLS